MDGRVEGAETPAEMTARVASAPGAESGTESGDQRQDVEAMDVSEASESEESEGFWRGLSARVISWRSMPPPLRLITGAAIAELLAAAAVIALHAVPAAKISMGLQSGRAIQMATPYFWLSVVFLIISISFLMAGALMLRWPLRLLALIIFSALTLYPAAASPYAELRLAFVVLLWLWGGAITLARINAPAAPIASDAPGPAERLSAPWRALIAAQHALRSIRSRTPLAGKVSLPTLTLLAMLLAQSAIYVALLDISDWTRSSSNLMFQLTIGTQQQLLAFAIVPFLFLAGSDFAEVGELFASGAAHLTSRAPARRSAWLTLGLTAVVALAIAVTTGPSVVDVSGFLLAYGDQLVLVALIALALFALLRWGKALSWATPKLPALALLLAALGYFALTWLGTTYSVAQTPNVARIALADYAVYVAPKGMTPQFSMPYPAGWKTSLVQSADGDFVTFSGLNQQYPGVAFLYAHPEPGATADTAAAFLQLLIHQGLTAGRTLTVHELGTTGAWRKEQFTLTDPAGKLQPLVGVGQSRALDGRDWAFVGLTPDTYQSVVLPVFDQMALGWRADGLATAPVITQADAATTINRISAIFLGLAPLLLGLALGFWFVRRGGPHRRAWQAAGVFVAAMGLLAGAEMAPFMAQMFGASSDAVWWVGLSVNGLQQIVALATLALVAYVALRRRADPRWIELVRLTLALNVGLLFVWLMYSLYDIAIGLSKSSLDHPLSWAEALIVLIALGWDLLMSGETFTNRDDERMPRGARLLLYLGYIMLTATLVMSFAAQTYTYGTSAHEPLFESEPWPQMGLQLLGVPMVICAFTLALVAWLNARRRETDAAGEVEGKVEVAAKSAAEVAPAAP